MTRWIVGALLLLLAAPAFAQAPAAPMTACDAQVQIIELGRKQSETMMGQILANQTKVIGDLTAERDALRAELAKAKPKAEPKAPAPKNP